METYSVLREFADSWMLLFLTVVFTGVIVWAFRPGSRKVHDEIAASIFLHDDKPAGGDTRHRRETKPASAQKETK